MGITYQPTPAISPTGSSYNDTTSVYGSPHVITASGTYDTTDWSAEYTTTKKVQKNSSGVPFKQFALPEVPTGSCNLIMASNSATIPAPGTQFTTDLSGSMAWLIDKVGTPYKQEDFFLVSLNFSQKLN